MIDKIIRDATVPGAFMNAVTAAQERSLEEKRRRGGYKVVETPEPQHRSALGAVRDWFISTFSRGSQKTDA